LGLASSVMIRTGGYVVPGALGNQFNLFPALKGGAISFRLLRRLAPLPTHIATGQDGLRARRRGIGKGELSGAAVEDNVFRLAIPLIRNPRMSGAPATIGKAKQLTTDNHFTRTAAPRWDPDARP